MLFNPDPSKPAQELLFFRKKVQIHQTISLNNIQIERTSHHKHLGILLHAKLFFRQHIDTAILKINSYICNKETQTTFAMEILNDNLQSFYKALNWLWRYHLWPTK